MQRLNNKKLVIIGGTTGLGLSAAKRFVEEGAQIVVVGRNPDSAAEAGKILGSEQCSTLVGDATAPETSREAIDLCLERWDAFDGLYHVAGGSGRKFGDGPLHEVTDQGIQTTLELNLHSIILSNRAAIQTWLERDQRGVILNMASTLGYSPSPAFFSTHVYAAAKSAVFGFAKSIAAYYAAQDIRVNTIAPALVETPMAQRAAQDPVITQFIKTKQPLDGGRIGHPQDLDGAAVYFMSDESRFVTGQKLAVDGGWSLSEGQISK